MLVADMLVLKARRSQLEHANIYYCPPISEGGALTLMAILCIDLYASVSGDLHRYCTELQRLSAVSRVLAVFNSVKPSFDLSQI